jgi:hypothetical protein
MNFRNRVSTAVSLALALLVIAFTGAAQAQNAGPDSLEIVNVDGGLLPNPQYITRSSTVELEVIAWFGNQWEYPPFDADIMWRVVEIKRNGGTIEGAEDPANSTFSAYVGWSHRYEYQTEMTAAFPLEGEYTISIECKVESDEEWLDQPAPAVLDLNLTVQKGTQSIGAVQHETVFTLPAPRSRTDIGIGESVTLWVDPATWSGPPGDSIGSITWSISGPGSISSSSGSSTVYTAASASADYSATITATIHDSDGICDALTAPATMDVKTPSGCQIALLQNLPLGTAGPPNNLIGAQAQFLVRVLPTTVNFKAIDFRENIPGDSWIWPSTNNSNRAAAVVAYNVQDVASTVNVVYDIATTQGWQIAEIAGQAFSHDIRVPQEYSTPGGWVLFYSETHKRIYKANGQAQIQENPAGAISGLQGPYATIP